MSLLQSARFETPETDYRRIFQRLNSPLAIVRLERGEAHLVNATNAFVQSLALPQSAIGGLLEEIFSPAQTFSVLGAVRRSLASGAAERVLADSAGRWRIDVHPLGRRQALLALETPPANHRMSKNREAVFDQLGALGAGMFYVLNASTGRISHVDRRFAAMFELPAKATTDALIERVHPHDLPRLMQHCDKIRAVAAGQTVEIVMRMRTAGGDWAWMRLRERPFSRDGAGSVRRILGVAFDVTEHEEMSRRLADVSAALATAEESERRRIGRELHDSTAQHLLAIDLSLSALERRGVPQASARTLSDIREALSAARREIRTFSYMLHPPGLADRGLVSTLRAFCDGFGKRAALDIQLEARLRGGRLPHGIELALFRVAQEALMNVHKHSGARTAHVRLYRAEDCAVLEVEDDGVGLSHDMLAGQAPAAGVGVNGMRARLAQLGGSLSLISDGGGLRVTACAPLPRN